MVTQRRQKRISLKQVAGAVSIARANLELAKRRQAEVVGEEEPLGGLVAVVPKKAKKRARKA